MASSLRALVVDDAPTAQEVLAQYVKRHEGLELIDTCGDAIEATNILRKTDVGLLLLDVEMPEMSGIELVESMDDAPAVVLVTGSEDYAVEAFELAAVDYLVKPVRYARFLKAISRVEEQRSDTESSTSPPKSPSPDAPPASPPPSDPSSTNTIFLHEDGDLVRVDLSDILFVEAKGDYMLVRTASARHMIHATMKEIEERFPSEAFARIHRSYLVRIDRIEKIEDNAVFLDEIKVPIGPTYRDALLERIQSL